MDELKKEEIKKQILKQKYILKHAEAKILKLESQLETGITRSSRNKPKGDTKVTKGDTKVTGKGQQTPPIEEKEKGFFETIFS